MLRKISCIISVAFFIVSVNCFSDTQKKIDSESRKLYVGLELGEQRVQAEQVVTAFGNLLIPYDRDDLAARISVGYLIQRYFAVETGFSSMSGYGYMVGPNNDSMNFGFYTLDFMAKLITGWQRIQFFAAGGGALVYTNLENFFAFNANDQPDPMYRAAYWPDHLFFRPRVAAGITFALTDRFSLAVVYSYLFGCGHFSSEIKSIDGATSLMINRHYLPDISMIGAAVYIKI